MFYHRTTNEPCLGVEEAIQGDLVELKSSRSTKEMQNLKHMQNLEEVRFLKTPIPSTVNQLRYDSAHEPLEHLNFYDISVLHSLY